MKGYVLQSIDKAQSDYNMDRAAFLLFGKDGSKAVIGNSEQTILWEKCRNFVVRETYDDLCRKTSCTIYR